MGMLRKRHRRVACRRFAGSLGCHMRKALVTAWALWQSPRNRIFHESIRPETVQRDCDVADCAVRNLFSKRDPLHASSGLHGANRPVGVLPDD